MRSPTTVSAPPRRATRAGSALPMVAAALGFGAGANMAVGFVVAAVVAASRTVTLDLSSAALPLAADAGLGLATGLAVALVALLAALAGHCAVSGAPRAGASNPFCRAALPAAAGASVGLLTAAWLLAQVVGFAEGGTAHALAVFEPSTAGLIAFAFAGGAAARQAVAVPRALADLGRRLGRTLQLSRRAAPPTRFAALATLSVAVLTVCGLVFGWSAADPSPDAAGAGLLIRPVSECPGRPADAPGRSCDAAGNCPPATRPAVGTATGPAASPRRAS